MANVIPFKEWTRRGQWRFTLPFRKPAKGVVVHHSVTRALTSPIESARVVEEVTYKRGSFAMIPYSFLLHYDGTILEGRAGKWRNGANRNDLRRNNLNNSNTISVCIPGDMRRDKITTAQQISFQWLLSDLKRRNIITVDAVVVPHNALANTACPSFNVEELLVPVYSQEGGEREMKIINDTERNRMWASWTYEGTTIVREYMHYRGPDFGEAMPGIGYIIDAQIENGKIHKVN
jgi:hypothetical protein